MDKMAIKYSKVHFDELHSSMKMEFSYKILYMVAVRQKKRYFLKIFAELEADMDERRKHRKCT